MNSRADIAEPGLAGPLPWARLRRYAVPVLIGLAPVLTMIFSWTAPGEPVSMSQRYVKAFALPVIGIELLIIALGAVGTGRWWPKAVPRARLWAAAGLVVLMFATASFAAALPALAVARTILWIIHAAFAWSVFRLCERSLCGRTALSFALMGGFLLFCALLMLFAAQVDDPTGFNWMHDLPGLDNIRRAAYFAAAMAGLSMPGLASGRSRSRILAATVYTVAVALIFWSGARGAALAIAAAVIIGAALFPRLRGIGTVIGALGATAAGICLGWLYSLRTGFPGFSRMLPQWLGGATMDPTAGATAGRGELWISTWHALSERPLFGYGESQTAYVVAAGREAALFHPHNLVLQVLLAWGIVGTMLLLYLAAPFARRAFADARGSADSLGPFMAMLILLLYSGIDGTLFHVHAVSLFAACAGLIAMRDARAGAA